MKDNIINKLYNYLVVLIFVELVLGGLGNLFGLPVRKVLFVLGISATLVMMYINKVKIKKSYIMPIVVVIGYVAYGSIVGLINGNSFRDIFSDANSFLGIIYLILLANYFREDFKKINKSIDLIVNASVIVALITIGLFFFSRLYLPQDHSIINKYMKLNDIFQYGLITGLVQSNNYARIYLFNGIFMQVGAMILFIKLMSKNIQKTIYQCSKLLILLIGIFVSNTRGFWLGAIAGIVFVVIYYIWKRKERKLVVKRIVAVLAIFYVFTLVLPFTITTEYTQQQGVASGTESTQDRLESIVDFTGNISNRIRVIQLEFLLKRVKEKPVLGWGFGAHVEEYSQYMADNNLPPVSSTNFELYYVELLFKTGGIGIIYLFGYLLYKFIQLILLLIKHKLEDLDEQVLVAWTIGFISFLVSSVSNPYLASLSGFFILVMECYILELALNKYVRIKE